MIERQCRKCGRIGFGPSTGIGTDHICCADKEVAKSVPPPKKPNAFVRWFCTPASFWQFWMPQSGIAGGVIAGAILSFIYLTVMRT